MGDGGCHIMPQLLDQDAKAFLGEHAETPLAYDVMQMEHKSACDIRTDFDKCNLLISETSNFHRAFHWPEDRSSQTPSELTAKAAMKKLTARARLNDSFVSRCLSAFTV